MEDIINTKKDKEIEKKYNKNQLLNSKKYLDKKDLLNVILENNKNYSFKEVDTLIFDFYKKKVK